MDLDSLRSFVTVVDCGSLRTAAGQLGMPLTALAAQLDDLEIRVGAALLQRDAEGGTPTEAGRLLHQDAVRLLASVEALRSRTSVPPDLPSGKVTVAAPLSLARVLMAPLQVRVRLQLPDVQLTVVSDHAEIALQKLLRGHADFALLADPPPSALLAWRPLVVEPMVLAGSDPSRLAIPMLIAPTSSPAAGGPLVLPAIRMADAARLPMVAHTSQRLCRRNLDARFAALGLKPDIVLESDAPPLMDQMVRQGRAYVIAPSSFVATETLPPGGVRARLVEPDWARTLGLAWLPGREVSPAARAVATMIREEMAGAINGGSWSAELLDNPEYGFE